MYVYETAKLESQDLFEMWELVSSSFVFVCLFVFWPSTFFFPMQITQKLERRIKHTKIWFNVYLSFPFDFVDVSKLLDKNSPKFHDPLFFFSSVSVLPICEVAMIASVLPLKGLLLPVLAQWSSIFLATWDPDLMLTLVYILHFLCKVLHSLYFLNCFILH